MITVRAITPADISGLAGIHVRCYREANRGIVPADYLAKMKASGWQGEWERRFTQGVSGEPAFERHFLAEDSRAGIVGFAGAGPSRDAQLKYEGEIYDVYVLSGFQGSGVGRSLVSASVEFLRRRRMKSMLLWVFEGNARAREFFEHFGGVLVKLKKDVSIDGNKLVEIPYAWTDLPALLAQLGKPG
jgi:ribosomal protein S18 acetylase RimI-like enzyme